MPYSSPCYDLLRLPQTAPGADQAAGAALSALEGKGVSDPAAGKSCEGVAAAPVKTCSSSTANGKASSPVLAGAGDTEARDAGKGVPEEGPKISAPEVRATRRGGRRVLLGVRYWFDHGDAVPVCTVLYPE